MIFVPVIYIDTLFLINFIFNTAIFYISGYLLKKDISAARLVLTAVAASLYGVGVVFEKIVFLYGGAAKIFIFLLFVLILFGKQSKRELLKNCIVCFFSALVFGGSVWLLISLLNIKIDLGAIIMKGIVYIDINPLILFLGICTGMFFLIFFSVAEKRREKSITELKIFFKEKQFEVKALYDTGCSLAFGDLPAVIVNKKVLDEDFFADTIWLCYSTVGREKEKIAAFVPDRIEDLKGRSYRGIIAAGSESLGDGENYNAVLNPALLK